MNLKVLYYYPFSLLLSAFICVHLRPIFTFAFSLFDDKNMIAMEKIASDIVIDQAYEWLCRRGQTIKEFSASFQLMSVYST